MSRNRFLDLFLLYNVRQVGHQATECLLYNVRQVGHQATECLLYNVRQVGHQATECLLQHCWDVNQKIRHSVIIDTVLVTSGSEPLCQEAPNKRMTAYK